jgi:phosphatidylglycerol lysyltransferase
VTRILRRVAPFLTLVLFVVALVILHRALGEYHYHDLQARLAAIPLGRLLLAFTFTFLSYATLTVYDVLGLRYARQTLPYGRVALASFLGNAFSHNLGASVVSGGALRYRLYSSWGLAGPAIGQVIVFCGVTFWIGLLTLGGAALLLENPLQAVALHAPGPVLHVLGGLCLLLVLAYLAWAFLRSGPIRIRDYVLPVPRPGLALAQIATSSLEWCLTAAALYVLLPPAPGLTFGRFLWLYLTAQFVALVSQVPGGLGVLETVLLVLLAPAVPADAALGSLLVFRLLYYLLPLGIAALILGAHELLRGREKATRAVRVIAPWVPRVVPHVLGLTTTVAGALLLFSGATPGVGDRMAWLDRFLPLPILEMSHFLGSLAGAGLLVLARGLQRRLAAAYWLTAVLLVAGIVFSLLKGFDYEEASVLAVMLAALLPCRRDFYRKASLTSLPLGAGWVMTVAVILGCVVWLGLFAYKHVEYSHDLWWQFTLMGHAPRFLRATVGAAALIIIAGLVRLFGPAAPPAEPAEKSDPEKARPIVERSRDVAAHLAYLGDKRFLFGEEGRALIMYGIEGRTWAAMGDPVGAPDEFADLVWRFHQMSDRHGGWTVFYEVGPDYLGLYLDLGLSLVKLGEEARVPLGGLTLEGGDWKELRHVSRKLEREGCTFDVVPPEGVAALLPDLEAISSDWLKEKKAKEKGFSLGYFDASYLRRCPAALVRHEGRLVAFANVWRSADQEQLSVDLMRYRPGGPSNVMDFLFLRLMLWGKEAGYRWFNLGMAPLSGLEDRALSPLWHRVGTLVFRHGGNFYNFEGVRRYKEKFHPEWVPRYLACPGVLALPRVLLNVASLIAGSPKGVAAR